MRGVLSWTFVHSCVRVPLPRCTTPTVDRCCREFLACPQCLDPGRASRYGGAACKPLGFSVLTGAHEHRCAMTLGQLWPLRCARCPLVSVHPRPPPRCPVAPTQCSEWRRCTFDRNVRYARVGRRWCNCRGHCPGRSPLCTCTHCCIRVHCRLSVSMVWYCTRASVATATHHGTSVLLLLLLKYFVVETLRFACLLCAGTLQARSRLR